jgi:hypothetical protein
MGKIKVFVSYRRDDAQSQTDRLCEHLIQARRFDVFQDVDRMPVGFDFRRVLTNKVAGCDVFLAVIGDAWLSTSGPDGSRRLDDPADFVRIEIEAALARNIPVIPVLVGAVPVPKAADLPESLRELSFRHGVRVRPNPGFRDDMKHLIRGINEAVTVLRPPGVRLMELNRMLVEKPWLLIGFVLLFLISAVSLHLFLDNIVSILKSLGSLIIFTDIYYSYTELLNGIIYFTMAYILYIIFRLFNNRVR